MLYVVFLFCLSLYKRIVKLIIELIIEMRCM